MKIVLMGTNEWVLPAFERAVAEHDVVAVFTRAPAPAGRKKIMTPSPVHVWAAARGIPVHTNISAISNHKSAIDFIVVASYGVILRDEVLSAALCVNIHPSLLPKYRGPSPMLTAVYNGDAESGVCLMKMSAQVDAGDVYACEKFSIDENDTARDVEARVGEISANMLSEYLSAPEKYPARPQIGEPTFTRKFTGEDELIDWSRTPEQIHNQVRSIGGRTKINGVDVKILETKLILPPLGGECPAVRGEGGLKNNKSLPPARGNSAATPLQGRGEFPQLEIIRIQPAGKKPMAWKDFVNGLRGAEIKFGA